HMATDTIIARFMKQAEIRPDAPAYHVKDGDNWEATNWADYVKQVRTAGRALLSLGVGRKHNGASGDASCVCILGFNRPEWTVMDLACMAVGGAPAGIYTTCSPPEVAYIVRHTEAKVVLVENKEQWEKIKAERGSLPNLKWVVLMKGAEKIADPMVLSWDEFLAKAKETDDKTLQEYIDKLADDQLATLIYTSGTTGPPKGVMLSHKNLAWTAQCAIDMVAVGPKDCVVSYLPLSHIAEQMFTLHVPATSGSQVYFAESINKVADNFKEVRPTVLFAVPRIWEKFYAGVNEKMSKATGLKATLAGWARETGRAASALRNRGEEPGGWLGLKYRFFNDKVYSKLKDALGLGRARVCVSGAAPISQEIIEFFASLDIIIYEVYGQSEDNGPTSFNLPGKTKFGSVGPPIPGVQVKIAEDGEILVKGPNVFLGYYKDKAATDETLIKGWLHSGDLGKIDGEGFLHITGRKKDLIITAGGKNIAPKNIESALKDHPMIGEAVVIGDRRKFLTALISLDAEKAAQFAEEHDVAKDKLHESPQLKGIIQEHVDTVNKDLARVEQLKKFTILKKSFTHEGEGAELTPTLKVKRKIVNDKYADVIESMYAEDEKRTEKQAS
ncbi:MAG TPA: long-chain fatty acid--CoA ligase, partial [Polyangiaceae bacterium]|nr:long-chain fatty acid--CoA ligase [Polyangiaceae bacterium]